MALTYDELKIELHPDVYEPAEDSFLLAESMEVSKGDTVLDVGTGTGILALIAAGKAKRVLGVDLNPEAVRLARRNAKTNGVLNVKFLESDLFSKVSGKFNLIIFNPPYLPVMEEGLLARSWSGGECGLEVVTRFLEGVKAHLKPAGRILLIVSSLNGLSTVEGLFASHGFSSSVVALKKIPFETLYAVSAER
jgi:release factor glutamine methyltransferase